MDSKSISKLFILKWIKINWQGTFLKKNKKTKVNQRFEKDQIYL